MKTRMKIHKILGFTLVVLFAIGLLVSLAHAGNDAEKCLLLMRQGKYKEAFPYCKRAAKGGNTKAQTLLGVMYYYGQGVLKNFAKAAKWYRKASEQGQVLAQYNLGLMYFKGEGVPKNYAKAAKWFRKAAKQGDTRAQFNLGSMYVKGQGVPQSYAEAAKWFRKAAKQGDTKAQASLGAMYALGRGVMQSGKAAADWFYKAGLSFLQEGKRDEALRCVGMIKNLPKLGLTVPNLFLADKLMRKIYK